MGVTMRACRRLQASTCFVRLKWKLPVRKYSDALRSDRASLGSFFGIGFLQLLKSNGEGIGLFEIFLELKRVLQVMQQLYWVTSEDSSRLLFEQTSCRKAEAADQYFFF